MMMTSGEKVSHDWNRDFCSAYVDVDVFFEVRYKSFVDAGRQIVVKEGVKSLFGVCWDLSCGTGVSHF
jgi:hypothetical protein